MIKEPRGEDVGPVGRTHCTETLTGDGMDAQFLSHFSNNGDP